MGRRFHVGQKVRFVAHDEHTAAPVLEGLEGVCGTVAEHAGEHLGGDLWWVDFQGCARAQLHEDQLESA